MTSMSSMVHKQTTAPSMRERRSRTPFSRDEDRMIVALYKCIHKNWSYVERVMKEHTNSYRSNHGYRHRLHILQSSHDSNHDLLRKLLKENVSPAEAVEAVIKDGLRKDWVHVLRQVLRDQWSEPHRRYPHWRSNDLLHNQHVASLATASPPCGSFSPVTTETRSNSNSSSSLLLSIGNNSQLNVELFEELSDADQYVIDLKALSMFQPSQTMLVNVAEQMILEMTMSSPTTRVSSPVSGAIAAADATCTWEP